MRKTILLAAVASVAAFAAVPASAQVVVVKNGSFEMGTDPGSFTTVNSGQANIADWTVVSGSVDYIGSYWQASDGTRSIDLSGNNPGTISQTISGLTAGRSYRVTFDLAGNPDGGPETKVAVVSDAGAQSGIYSFNTAGTTRDNMGWQRQVFDFTALGSTVDLTFSNPTRPSQFNTPFGAALDNVGISAVPEPATWALMILGFGAVGGAMRRRKAQVAFA